MVGTLRRSRWVVSVLLGATVLGGTPVRGQYQQPPPPPAYALKGVTVHYADGRVQAGVNVVVRRGFLAALAPGAEIPPDATLLEGDSLHVYPGLVDGHGKAGLSLPQPPDRSGVAPWNPPRALQGFTPHRLAAWYLTGAGPEGRDNRKAGVVAAAVHPSGGMAPGQSSVLVFRKGASTPWETVARPSAGLAFSFEGARGVYPSTLFAVMAYFRQVFLDAARYGLALTEYARSPDGLIMPAWDPDLEVLRRAATGEMPVFFSAETVEDIRRVLSLSQEVGFQPVILGGEEAWKVSSLLRERKIPVFVSVAFPAAREWRPVAPGGEGEAALGPAALREKERLENAYANAARLVQAGVTVALTSGGRGGDFREGVAKAIEYGLPETEALKAVTAVPANLLGVPHLPVLRQGVAATFVVTDGPLFRKGTQVLWTFVEGEVEVGSGGAQGAAGAGGGTLQVAGSWQVQVAAQGMTLPFTMELTQEGSSFRGTMKSAEMGSEARVENGRIEGNSLTFTLVVTMGTESFGLEATGTIQGDRLTGSARGGPLGDFTFTAVRKPSDQGGVR